MYQFLSNCYRYYFCNTHCINRGVNLLLTCQNLYFLISQVTTNVVFWRVCKWKLRFCTREILSIKCKRKRAIKMWSKVIFLLFCVLLKWRHKIFRSTRASSSMTWKSSTQKCDEVREWRINYMITMYIIVINIVVAESHGIFISL